MTYDFTGKVAVVTGGAASIGLEIVRAFADAGAAAVSIDIKPPATGVDVNGAEFVVADIRDDEALASVVANVARRHGRIDFVVNCAAVYVDNGAGSSRSDWIETLNVNVVSAALLTEMARPHLAVAKGAIVNISSISAFAAQAGRWTYPVSKAALIHLTRQQALDYAADGIRANCVVAGWTWSDPVSALSGGDLARADRVGGEFHILGRIGRGAEVANAVLFLCSDLASFTTGGELKAEGGYLALGPEQATPAIAKLTGGAATVR